MRRDKELLYYLSNQCYNEVKRIATDDYDDMRVHFVESSKRQCTLINNAHVVWADMVAHFQDESSNIAEDVPDQDEAGTSPPSLSKLRRTKSQIPAAKVFERSANCLQARKAVDNDDRRKARKENGETKERTPQVRALGGDLGQQKK